jgi:hypothetical protein
MNSLGLCPLVPPCVFATVRGVSRQLDSDRAAGPGAHHRARACERRSARACRWVNPTMAWVPSDQSIRTAHPSGPSPIAPSAGVWGSAGRMDGVITMLSALGSGPSVVDRRRRAVHRPGVRCYRSGMACGVPEVGPGSLTSGDLRVGMIPT